MACISSLRMGPASTSTTWRELLPLGSGAASKVTRPPPLVPANRRVLRLRWSKGTVVRAVSTKSSQNYVTAASKQRWLHSSSSQERHTVTVASCWQRPLMRACHEQYAFELKPDADI
jgi:hypothetical protein